MKKLHVTALISLALAGIVIGIVTLVGRHTTQPSHAVNQIPTTPNTPAASSVPFDTYRVLRLTDSENDQGGGGAADPYLQEQSEHFGVIVDGVSDYSGKIAQMHAWSTDANNTNNGKPIIVLAYQGGSHIGGCTNAVKIGSMAVDPAGNYLSTQAYPNSFLMDITQSGWQSYIATHSQSTLSSDGYDGVWMDVLGPESLSNGYNIAVKKDCKTQDATDTNKVPANANGAPISSTTWIQGGAAVLSAIHGATSGHTLGFNGVRPGGLGYNSDPLLQNADIGMTENWMFGENKTTVASFTYWKANVDELINAHNMGKSVQAYTKMPDVAEPEQDVIHKFTLASFLLGTDGNQYFQFRTARTFMRWQPVTSTYPNGLPWYKNLLIGKPTGTYSAIGGASGCQCMYTVMVSPAV